MEIDQEQMDSMAEEARARKPTAKQKTESKALFEHLTVL
jgi:hypothetical protein